MPRISMDGPENELAMVAIKMRLIHFLLVSPHFLQSKLCRVIYDSWRDAWRQAGCSISDSRGERGNRARVHIFFDSGDMAAASTEHGREPQRTQATALAKRGWHRISREVVWRAVKL